MYIQNDMYLSTHKMTVKSLRFTLLSFLRITLVKKYTDLFQYMINRNHISAVVEDFKVIFQKKKICNKIKPIDCTRNLYNPLEGYNALKEIILFS